MENPIPQVGKMSVARVGALAFSLLLVLLSGAGYAGAVDGGAPPARPENLVWHDGELWDTVVLGAIHGNPNPNTLDAFYIISGQNPVAGAGPGDADYNGGRWLPTTVLWVGAGAQPLFLDGDDVEAAIASDDLVVTSMGTPFLCPLTNPNA